MLNENMPNFNHRNPFVIVCSQTRSRLDDKILYLAKQWIISTIILVFCSLIGLGTTILTTFVMKNENIIYSAAELIGTGFIVFNLIYHCVVSHKFSRLTNDPIRENVKKLMKSQLSEVATMNNEKVNQAIIDMNFILGRVSVLFNMVNIEKWFSILIGIYYMLILVGCIFY